MCGGQVWHLFCYLPARRFWFGAQQSAAAGHHVQVAGVQEASLTCAAWICHGAAVEAVQHAAGVAAVGA